jgi:hypothetical protein
MRLLRYFLQNGSIRTHLAVCVTSSRRLLLLSHRKAHSDGPEESPLIMGLDVDIISVRL